MPKIYIIDERAPNAFATGLKPEDSAIAVTAGLLARLNRDELQGVVAHEMSHIINRDVQFMTLASIMLGSIVLMSQVFLRGMWFTGGGSSKRYRKGGGGGGGVHPALIVVTILLAILGPIFARLLYFAISRKREYLADASAARLTRYPEGLASALEKISSSPLQLEASNKVTAPMYIVNPLRAKDGAALSGLGSTHPSAAERIAILRTMSHGAGLLSYQRAFSKVKGKPTMVIPSSGLKKDKETSIRDPHPDAVAEKSGKEQARDVMDLMRAVNGFAFLICACGLKIKVPPDYGDSLIPCPRCKRENEIPKAAVSDITEAAAVVGAMVGALSTGGAEDVPMAKPIAGSAAKGKEAPLAYKRRTDGWESFACACGHMLQLSPAFNSSQMRCPKCRRITRVQ
jgi:heat shock protein HtpX